MKKIQTGKERVDNELVFDYNSESVRENHTEITETKFCIQNLRNKGVKMLTNPFVYCTRDLYSLLYFSLTFKIFFITARLKDSYLSLNELEQW